MNNNLDLDLDSDSDEYIDLSTCIQDNLKNIFQFHLLNEKLSINHIGKSTDTPDIIIMENFGPDLNMSLYNCVYSQDELESIKNNKQSNENIEEITIESDLTLTLTLSPLDQEEFDTDIKHLKLFFPIVKLIKKNNLENYTITSIVVKLNQEILLGEEIKNWELYWIKNSSLDKEYFKTKKLEKNINPSNILENIIKLSL
jgi:hypothetical protein